MPSDSRHPHALPCLAAALLLAASLPAAARLGGDEASVYADAATLGTVVTRQDEPGYVRFDLAQANRVIHEYAGVGGTVFAISFAGRSTPALDGLLGNYADTYAASLHRARGDHRHATVETPTLRAALHGRPHAVTGRVWVPGLVPAGVDLETLP